MENAENRIPRKVEGIAEIPSGRKISLRREKAGKFQRIILKFLKQETTFTVHLDPLGSAAWKLIDGARTAQQILSELRKEFPEESQLGQRLGAYLSIMIRNKFITLN